MKVRYKVAASFLAPLFLLENCVGKVDPVPVPEKPLRLTAIWRPDTEPVTINIRIAGRQARTDTLKHRTEIFSKTYDYDLDGPVAISITFERPTIRGEIKCSITSRGRTLDERASRGAVSSFRCDYDPRA